MTTKQSYCTICEARTQHTLVGGDTPGENTDWVCADCYDSVFNVLGSDSSKVHIVPPTIDIGKISEVDLP